MDLDSRLQRGREFGVGLTTVHEEKLNLKEYGMEDVVIG